METSRLLFSLTVGLGLILLGTVVATKAAIGITLMATGLGLIAITLLSGKWLAQQSAAPALLPIALSDNNPALTTSKRRG